LILALIARTTNAICIGPIIWNTASKLVCHPPISIKGPLRCKVNIFSEFVNTDQKESVACILDILLGSQLAKRRHVKKVCNTIKMAKILTALQILEPYILK
jgi:hypothetical protein